MGLTSVDDRLLLPPHNEEAEQACLGSCLIDPEAFDKVSEILTGPEDFYQKAYQEIYAAMVYLAENTGVIDLLTVCNYLREHGKLEYCGGVARLNDIIDAVRSSAHVSAYAKIVADNALSRRLLRAGEAISRLAVDQEVELPQRVDQAEEVIFGVGNSRSRGELEPIADALKNTFDEAYKRFEEGKTVSGVATGFTEFDELTNGLHPANLIVVGARPSMGKTAFALSIAVNVALAEKPGKVAIFSLEMPREDLCQRMMCSVAKVNAQSLRSGKLNSNDWGALAQAVDQLSKAPIFIDDSGSVTILDMKAKLRRMKKRSGVDLVIIDYLQLIKGSSTNRGSSERIFEISEISRQLKGLSKELNVPIVALSQLSRNVESRQDKRPLLSDLRESGAIEQDADLVAFLYRDEYYNKQSTELNIAEIIVAKHRNGPIGNLKLKFIKQYGGFYNKDENVSSETYTSSNSGGKQTVSFGPNNGFTISVPNRASSSQSNNGNNGQSETDSGLDLYPGDVPI